DHSLSAPQLVPGSNGTFETATADVNRDGRPDLVISSDYGLKVLLNTRTGWTSRTVSPQTFRGLNVGDVTGDGRPDIVVCCGRGPQTFRLFTQRSDGAFAEGQYRSFGVNGMLLADVG